MLDIDLHASVCPITFGDTKEGSIGIRINDSNPRAKKAKASGIERGRQDRRKGMLGPALRLVRLLRPDRRQGVGLAIFDDPNNPNPGVLARPRLRPDGGQPVRPDKSGFPAVEGQDDLVKLAKGEH